MLLSGQKMKNMGKCSNVGKTKNEKNYNQKNSKNADFWWKIKNIGKTPYMGIK